MSEITSTENSSKTVLVPIQVPMFVPSEEIVQSFRDKFPGTTQHLIETGWMTTEEAVSYHQYHLMMCELASNVDEFVNMYRAVKKEMARKESGIILPNEY